MMAGLGDMFGASLATVNGKKPRNSDRIAQTTNPLGSAFDSAAGVVKQGYNNAKAGLSDPSVLAGYVRKGFNIDAITKAADWRMAGLDAMTGSSDMPRDVQRAGVDAAMNLALNAPAQTVWHGSPHKFDKFDMSKIGTGEGAQAYGHGLYMAESPAVAQEYAEKLAANRFINFPGGTPSTDAEKRIAESLLSRANTTQTGYRESAISEAYNRFANPPKHMIGDPSTPKWAMPSEKEISRAIEEMNAAKRLGVPSLSDSSQLYKADIPDEAVARFLDWDKPLSQQAPEVQAALQSMTNDVLNGGFDLSRSPRNLARAFGTSAEESAIKQVQDKYGLTNSGGSWFDKNGNPVAQDAVSQFVNKKIGKGYESAGDLYSDLTHVIGDQAGVSAALRNNNIPGIRYLDRGAGAGSSNFVLFDDQMPRILEVNGQATGAQPWKPGEYQSAVANAFNASK